MLTQIESTMNDLLGEEASILSLSQSSEQDSIYILFRRGDFHYMPIRLSDHSKNAFFSNKTFYIMKDIDALSDDIRHHLAHSDWYIFRYEDYFALEMLKRSNRKNLKIYIDNSMSIFDHSKMGLLFYQIRYFNRNHKEMNVISESFQKQLRRLFAAGLINGYRQGNKDLLVYVTQMGQAMIYEYKEMFHERFMTDLKKANFQYVEIPTASAGEV